MAQDTVSKTTVFILGHSFIRRLQSWCSPRSLLNMNLDPQRVTVFWHGEGGATIANERHVKSIWGTLPTISELSPNIVLLEKGSNDLCNYMLQPQMLVHQIFRFVESLLHQGCALVILSEILPRQFAFHFNAGVAETNKLLWEGCLSHTTNILFWSHSRQNFNSQ